MRSARSHPGALAPLLTDPTATRARAWWSDHMEGPLYWSPTGTAGDSLCQLDPAAARTGAQGLLLRSRTTGATTGDIIEGTATRPAVHPAAWDYRGYLRTPNIDRLSLLTFGANFLTASHTYQALLVYNIATHAWSIRKAGGSYQIIAGLTTVLASNTWYHVALSAQTTTLRYLAATVAAETVDLTAYGLYDAGAGATEEVRAVLGATAATDNPLTLYLDDVEVWRT